VTSAYLSFSYWVRRGVTAIPDARGLVEDEARALLGAAGLIGRRADVPRFSAEVAAGRVLESRPAAGSLVKRGAEIELVLSRGEERIRVPDLGGKALTAARLTLEGEGLSVGTALAIYSSRGPAGTVVGQEPGPGTELGGRDPVHLLVAREELRPAWVMPDLVTPRSAISGSTRLEVRKTRHLFLRQSLFVERLREWIDGKSAWPPLVRSIALKWLNDGLHDRCITRDLSWGVPVDRPGGGRAPAAPSRSETSPPLACT